MQPGDTVRRWNPALVFKPTINPLTRDVHRRLIPLFEIFHGEPDWQETPLAVSRKVSKS
jgi:hypothetical protein